MDLTHAGLAGTPIADAYLKERYDLDRVKDLEGVPVYFSQNGEYFVGGYKHIYTVIQSDPSAFFDELTRWRSDKAVVRCSFSVRDERSLSNRLDLVLELPPSIQVAERLSLYARNAQKHVKKAASSPIHFVAGAASLQWYDLYSAAMLRRTGTARPLEWFKDLERNFGRNIVVIMAHDKDVLVGALYCLTAPGYIQFAYIASDPAYRPMRLDSGLYDHAIVYAIKNSLRVVDFGPTMRADIGHWSIKADFGAQRFCFIDTVYQPFFSSIGEVVQVYYSRTTRRLKKYLA